MSFEDTTLWKSLEEPKDQFVEHREKLVHEFRELRKKAARLTSEIAQDLPEYTVHDIEHLDALWLVADQIVGDQLHLNPLEIFVLGASFLFHDAGMTMAAYPGGWKEITSTPEWQKIERRTANEQFQDETEKERSLLGLFLREQHASRAAQLPFVEWQTKEGTLALFQDHNTRLKLGKFIGEVSASHWWNHDDLSRKLGRVIPAPTGYPREWTLDLLKVACVLRTADAANVDSSRAPGFLWALRKGRISDYSNMHWLFQNRLTLPELRHETLVYAATQDFERSETKEWWLAFDTLTMVDNELRRSDALLARHTDNTSRLAAKRVANIDTPSALTSQITVRGWAPIDTAFSIDDIPRLVEKLGGEQLYGKKMTAPIRELIQNGMDAVRLRRKLDQGFETGCVRVMAVENDGVYQLVIEDDGVGLSFDTIVRDLLAFGTSGWLNDPAIGDFTDIFPTTDSVSGQYGIGFFSVFMLAKEIKVTSRRFDCGPNDTVVLEFENGLKQRPTLYQAERLERMPRAGTKIEINLEEELFLKLTSSKDSRAIPLLDRLQHIFPTSEVDLDVSFLGREIAIGGKDWRTEPATDFLKRISGNLKDEEGKQVIDWERTAKYLKPVLSDTGEVVGRIAGIVIRNREEKITDPHLNGALVYKGARISNESFLGVLEGTPIRASRDAGIPTCTPDSLRAWLEEQAALVGNDDIGETNALWLGTSLLKIESGNNPFPVCRMGNKLVNLEDLRENIESFGEVKLSYLSSLEKISDVVELKWVDPTLLSVDDSFMRDAGIISSASFIENSLPEELLPFGKRLYGENPPILKVACSYLGLKSDLADFLVNSPDFFRHRSMERHVATDITDGEHRFETVHLTQNMTMDEFHVANPKRSDVLD